MVGGRCPSQLEGPEGMRADDPTRFGKPGTMAVYTDVSDEDLASFLRRYDLGTPLGFKGIAEGVSNSNFFLTTDRGRFILTIFEERTDAQGLPFFMGLMGHLAKHGIACPAPIADRDGSMIGSVAGKPAAIVSYLDGLSVRRPDAGQCREAGATLAKMHVAGQDFSMTRVNSLGLAGWSDLLLRALPRADRWEKGIAPVIEHEMVQVSANWPEALPRGVIHADLFPDNVFFAGGKVTGVIDFYFACTDILAYDLAIMVNAWCFEPDLSYNVTKARAMIGGYHAVRPLQAKEIAAFPLLMRGASMRFFATRLYDWLAALDAPPGQLVRPHDPRPYWQRILFHQKSQSVADYGWEA
jgi:homoserine kinase type II